MTHPAMHVWFEFIFLMIKKILRKQKTSKVEATMKWSIWDLHLNNDSSSDLPSDCLLPTCQLTIAATTGHTISITTLAGPSTPSPTYFLHSQGAISTAVWNFNDTEEGGQVEQAEPLQQQLIPCAVPVTPCPTFFAPVLTIPGSLPTKSNIIFPGPSTLPSTYVTTSQASTPTTALSPTPNATAVETLDIVERGLASAPTKYFVTYQATAARNIIVIFSSSQPFPGMSCLSLSPVLKIFSPFFLCTTPTTARNIIPLSPTPVADMWYLVCFSVVVDIDCRECANYSWYIFDVNWLGICWLLWYNYNVHSVRIVDIFGCFAIVFVSLYW